MRRKGKPRSKAPRYTSLTAREKATRERALALLSDLRRGVGSYPELLRKHRITSWGVDSRMGNNAAIPDDLESCTDSSRLLEPSCTRRRKYQWGG
jgi:hypothetical protein